MSKRHLSTDPITGLMTWHDYDALTDRTTIIHTADAEAVLEANKAMQNHPEISRQGIKECWWKYASIPVGLQVKWLIEDGLDVYNPRHSDRLTKKLEDPEYRHLKATSGHHKLKGI